MHNRSTQRKGDTGVAQALATFIKLGYDVSIPFTESAAYDLIVDIGGSLVRVQARYTSTVEVDLRRTQPNSGRYLVKGSGIAVYDWLYILTSEGKEYLIKQCLSHRRSVRPQQKYLLHKMLSPARQTAPR